MTIPSKQFTVFILSFLLSGWQWLLISCQSGPMELTPISGSLPSECYQPFPTGNWQFIHTIEAEMGGGKKSFFMGITRVFQKDRKLRCVLMTMEGFVLLDASFHKGLTIHRSVPPFDSTEFAMGLINDIQLTFFQPPGRFLEWGLSPKEADVTVCRYADIDNGIRDILVARDGRWKIVRYNRNGSPIRQVIFHPNGTGAVLDAPLSGELILVSLDKYRYRLTLNLIEARQLDR